MTLLDNVASTGCTPVLLVIFVVVESVDVLPLLHLTVVTSGVFDGVTTSVVQLPTYLAVPEIVPLVMPPPVHPEIDNDVVVVAVTLAELPMIGNATLYFTEPVSFVHVGNAAAAAPAELETITPAGMNNDNAINSPAARRTRTPSW